MAIPIYEMEGTWDEITLQAPSFAEQRLRVEIYPLVTAKATDKEANRTEANAIVLREIVERTEQIKPKGDTRD